MTVMGQAPESAPAVAPVPSAPDHADTVELRLALVCYGGVSLAIYMHGVTKEIQKLVAASKAYEQDQSSCPFEPGETERAYWQALRDLETRDRVRTRVVVDVIAGTSAGGINGIILAKALAHDLPQDSLRDVWLERGDIKQLMASRAARVGAVPAAQAPHVGGRLGREGPRWTRRSTATACSSGSARRSWRWTRASNRAAR